MFLNYLTGLETGVRDSRRGEFSIITVQCIQRQMAFYNNMSWNLLMCIETSGLALTASQMVASFSYLHSRASTFMSIFAGS